MKLIFQDKSWLVGMKATTSHMLKYSLPLHLTPATSQTSLTQDMAIASPSYLVGCCLSAGEFMILKPSNPAFLGFLETQAGLCSTP